MFIYNKGRLEPIEFDKENLSKILYTENITVEPYKFTIYTEGDFFTEHTDSCTRKEFIGTVVVGLTDDYEGGNLVVRHRETVKYQLKKFDWCFFYGNCKHEIEEVTSGVRVCMVYKVYAEDSEAILSVATISNREKAEMIADEIAHIADTFIFECEHEYGRGTGPSQLKGSDSVLYDALERRHGEVYIEKATIGAYPEEIEAAGGENKFDEWSREDPGKWYEQCVIINDINKWEKNIIPDHIVGNGAGEAYLTYERFVIRVETENRVLLFQLDNMGTFDELSAVEFEDILPGRQGAVLGTFLDTSVPIVRTTTCYKKPIQEFLPVHRKIIDKLSEIGSNVNNAMIEIYDKRYKSMGFHSDQALDLKKYSDICIFSHYDNGIANRKLMFKRKDSGKLFEIVLKHNSVVVLPRWANEMYLHKIVLDTDKDVSGRWLGITFRESERIVDFTARPQVGCVPYLGKLVENAPFLYDEPFRMATDEERKEFYEMRSRENKDSYTYPHVPYTISESDLICPFKNPELDPHEVRTFLYTAVEQSEAEDYFWFNHTERNEEIVEKLEYEFDIIFRFAEEETYDAIKECPVLGYLDIERYYNDLVAGKAKELSHYVSEATPQNIIPYNYLDQIQNACGS